MKSYSKRRKQRKNDHIKGITGGDKNSKNPPEFTPEAGEEESHLNPNKKVAKLKLHADTETADRSKLTLPELMGAQVGHTWVSLHYNDTEDIPDTMDERTQVLLQHDLASFGFWPLVNRTGDWTLPEPMQERVDAGFTPGAGTSDNPNHRGFSLNPFKYVPGRVEEPDNAHAPKGSIEYELTQEQVDNMMKYIEKKRNADYSLYWYNCTTFGVEAAEAAGQDAPSGSKFGVCLPNALYKDMYNMSLRGEADVDLAPLQEGESHGKPTAKTRRHLRKQQRQQQKS